MLSEPRPRVLCVDDDADAREMLSELLKFSLIETRAVGTAVQALSLIEAEHFDLYLLDACLPDLDGIELCRRVRVMDPHTPIIFYSGAAYDDDKKRAIEAGANDYVIKPDIYRLLGSVTELVSGRESRGTDSECDVDTFDQFREIRQQGCLTSQDGLNAECWDLRRKKDESNKVNAIGGPSRFGDEFRALGEHVNGSYKG